MPNQDRIRPALRNEYVAPRTETESEIALICAEVLRVSPVGVTDNLFELGIHSLAVMRIISRLCASFRVELDIGAVFDCRNVADIEQLINGARADSFDLDDSHLSRGRQSFAHMREHESRIESRCLPQVMSLRYFVKPTLSEIGANRQAPQHGAHIRFLFIVPHLWIGLQITSCDVVLAILLTLGSANIWCGDSLPVGNGSCPAHTKKLSGAVCPRPLRRMVRKFQIFLFAT